MSGSLITAHRVTIPMCCEQKSVFRELLAQCLIARSAREDRALEPLPSSLTRRRKACLLVRSSSTAARDPGRLESADTRSSVGVRVGHGIAELTVVGGPGPWLSVVTVGLQISHDRRVLLHTDHHQVARVGT